MTNIPFEYIILLIVFLFQLLISIATLIEANRIKSIFSSNIKDYFLKNETLKPEYGSETIERPLVFTNSNNKKLGFILGDINEYLRVHYTRAKSPDLQHLESLIKNESKIFDARVSLLASFPILIGLAGTIVGLLYAFQQINIQDISIQEDAGGNSGNFLTLISKSSSIVFWGSLTGILLSIFLNYFSSTRKLQRDLGANKLILFLNTRLSPELPTVKEETISLISQQLSFFSETYFEQFRTYSEEFDTIANKIKDIYEIGFEEIIGKNTVIMEKLITHIDSLEELNRVTRAVRIRPEMINEFVDTSDKLIDSSDKLINSNKTSIDKLTGYGQLLHEVNESFKGLQARVDDGVINLTTDRKLITDFHEALKIFANSTKERTERMTQFAEEFDNNISQQLERYKYSLSQIGDSIERNMEKNLTPENYQSLLENIQSIFVSLESESNNIKLLSESLGDLNTKVNKELTPAITKIASVVSNLSSIVTDELPRKLNETVKTNEKLILTTSQQLLKEPRSWGQWSFLGVKKLFSRSKKKSR